MKNKVGRPTLNPAYRIRAQAWFNAVSIATGKTSSELEILFANRNVKRKIISLGANPGLWRKYKLGLSCPKTKPSKGRKSIVDRVEESFPGTSKWMSLPFWDVLTDTPIEMGELKNIYLSLSQQVLDLIIIHKTKSTTTFWRKQTDIPKLCQQLINFGNLDAATAILALIKEAEATQNQYMHLYLFECWAKNSTAMLKAYPELFPLLNKINDIIQNKFSSFSYFGDDGKLFKLNEDMMQRIMTGESSLFTS